ncbi:hypothetical protein LCM23_12850 [Cytobacillus kochii]|uniref:hypothetical protein n=1 Tax=Cytobacillus kochii TaxID=859143 RepID=UPI001CD707E5|nr:hypothetical protein [Cytobacillus kochii]MCA1026982.1 hypothetical protein [Cytobacillus kochii]
MITSRYKVILEGFEIELSAFNRREALILAQAEAIKNGRNYKPVSIEEIILIEE